MSKNQISHKLKIPKSVKVKRHIVDDEIRYTVDNLLGFQKLVAIAICEATKERFIWICNGFST